MKSILEQALEEVLAEKEKPSTKQPKQEEKTPVKESVQEPEENQLSILEFVYNEVISDIEWKKNQGR